MQRYRKLTAGKAFLGLAIYGPYSSACSKVGCVSAGLSLVEDSPAFSFYDDKGAEVANMQWNKKLGAQLMLGGLEAEQQATLALDSTGTRLGNPSYIRSITRHVQGQQTDLEGPIELD